MDEFDKYLASQSRVNEKRLTHKIKKMFPQLSDSQVLDIVEYDLNRGSDSILYNSGLGGGHADLDDNNIKSLVSSYSRNEPRKLPLSNNDIYNNKSNIKVSNDNLQKLKNLIKNQDSHGESELVKKLIENKNSGGHRVPEHAVYEALLDDYAKRNPELIKGDNLNERMNSIEDLRFGETEKARNSDIYKHYPSNSNSSDLVDMVNSKPKYTEVPNFDNINKESIASPVTKVKLLDNIKKIDPSQDHIPVRTLLENLIKNNKFDDNLTEIMKSRPSGTLLNSHIPISLALGGLGLASSLYSSKSAADEGDYLGSGLHAASSIDPTGISAGLANLNDRVKTIKNNPKKALEQNKQDISDHVLQQTGDYGDYNDYNDPETFKYLKNMLFNK